MSKKKEGIIIPEGVKVILPESFKGCDAEFVELPASLTKIGSQAFAGSKSLKRIKFPSNSQLEIIDYQAFEGCINLEEVELPVSLTRLESGAFAGTGIKEITIHGNITWWGERTFEACPILNKVTIEEGIDAIPLGTFLKCKLLEEVNLPHSLEEIRGRVFEECESLEEIMIPATLKEIGDFCFYKCISLKKVAGFGTTQVKMIPLSTFEGCICLQDINLPSLEGIGDRAFMDSNVIFNKLPKGLKTIGYFAFKNCIHITSLEIPASVRVIGKGFLANCKFLEELEIPYSATTNVGTDWVPANLNHIIFDDLEISGDDNGSLYLNKSDFEGTRLKDYFEAIYQIYLLNGKQKAIEAMVSYAGVAG